MKRLTIFFALIFPVFLYGQRVDTYIFAERSEGSLFMDVYQPAYGSPKNQCVVFVFGGGFISGSRTEKSNVEFMQKMADKGYTAIAIDYRLGLKGAHPKGLSFIKNVENAINVATEDLFAAIQYIIENADALRVDISDIVLIGSSAGAITVLQADYELNNGFELAANLPKDFHFGGVIPFSGAIFSREGKIKYREHAPAPTFFLHGTNDKLVNYKQIQIFNLGMFGANALIKRFEKNDYPYLAIRFDGLGHDVAGYMSDYVDQIEWFIDNYVDGKRNLQIDTFYNDSELGNKIPRGFKPKDLYK